MMPMYNGLNTLLSNVQEMTSLQHGCTHMAEWLELMTNELMHVTPKEIVDDNFHQVNYFHV